MLRALKIDNFKSFKKVSVEFGRVNLFIGGNGAGKSNILEAVGIVSAALSRGLSDFELQRKGVRLTPARLMKSAFRGKLPKDLSLEATFDDKVTYRCNLTSSDSDSNLRFQHEKCSRDNTPVFGRGPNGAKVNKQSIEKKRLDKSRGFWDQINIFEDIDPTVRKQISKIEQYAIYSPQTEFLRGRRVIPHDTPSVGLHGEGLPDAVRELLREARRVGATRGTGRAVKETPIAKLISSALDITFAPGWAKNFGAGRISQNQTSKDVATSNYDTVYFVDEFMHADRNKLSAYDSSEGSLFLLFAAILVAHPESPKIFAFDNVDSALNPKLTRLLLEHLIASTNLVHDHALEKGPEQIFLTTHNPTSLDAFDLFDDDHRIFVVERNTHGHSTIRRLTPPKGVSRDQWVIAAAGRNLSELWIDDEIPGALGL